MYQLLKLIKIMTQNQLLLNTIVIFMFKTTFELLAFSEYIVRSRGLWLLSENQNNKVGRNSKVS